MGQDLLTIGRVHPESTVTWRRRYRHRDPNFHLSRFEASVISRAPKDIAHVHQSDLHWVQGIGPLRLALMARPRGGEWLEDEVAGWCRESIDVVVSLLESHEVRDLELQEQPAICRRRGIEFLPFPIKDRGVPASENELIELVVALLGHLGEGRSVAVHCRAGIGRTGLVAGCLLHLLGIASQDIFPLLSRSRGTSMPDTDVQSAWVERFSKRHSGRVGSSADQAARRR